MRSENCLHPACLEIEKLSQACDFVRTRSRGPGGQHRNKVETMIIVTHRPSGIMAQASERRSQLANKEVALQRLRENLAIEYRSQNTPISPSDLWQKRCIGGKISCSVGHIDFACLLAEALDWIAHNEYQIAPAAKQLNCSTSQLIRFIKKSDHGLSWVNKRRKTLNLGPLK